MSQGFISSRSSQLHALDRDSTVAWPVSMITSTSGCPP